MFAADLSEMPPWVWWVGGFLLLVAIGRWRNRPSSRRARPAAADSSGFAEVAGCEEAVEDLRELVSFLSDPGRFERFGARVPRGALLVGPPGTGKTLLARSVAAASGVPFLSASGSDFVEMYVGVGAKRIRELYQEARSHGRAIVFIDEIDALARRRGGGESGGVAQPAAVEHENTLIALLTELDGFAESEVITIAATNRPDVLDPAVTRPGRLDRRIEVPVPDREGRAAVLAVHVAGKPVAADVDLEAVAARTPGMSGAELARVVNEAALTAVRRGLDAVDRSCFDEAVELVALGRTRPSAKVTERDRRIAAWHEAGHALCAVFCEHAEDPLAVSIVPRGPAGGVTWMGVSDDRYMTGEQAFDRLVVLLGGRSAEELLLGGGCTQGAATDLEQATSLATTMVDRLGFTGRGLAVRSGGDARSRRQVDLLLEKAHAEARALLTEHLGALEEVARVLLDRERLSGEELRSLLSASTDASVLPAGTASPSGSVSVDRAAPGVSPSAVPSMAAAEMSPPRARPVTRRGPGRTGAPGPQRRPPRARRPSFRVVDRAASWWLRRRQAS